MLHVNIKKQLKKNGNVTLDLDVKFSTEAGINVLFGPSGSGKTTVLRTIAGILTPDEGKIHIGERVYYDSSLGINASIQNRRVGFVFQDWALFPHLTAEQNVAYGVRAGAERRKSESVQELFTLLGMESRAKSYPRELSGGEQQRVALARALACDPLLLLLDEPLSAVDATTRLRLLEEIIAIQTRFGIPFIYVTHNQAEAVHIGDYALIFSEGRIVQEGKPLAVFNAPENLAASRAVGSENILVGQVLKHKAAEGITMVNLKGCQLEVSYNALPIGSRAIIAIRSEDIIVCSERITHTSARNLLEGIIKNIIIDGEKAELVVVCGVDFKVSITVGTIETLSLKQWAKVYLLIKARSCRLMI